jgi:hypothetical protein
VIYFESMTFVGDVFGIILDVGAMGAVVRTTPWFGRIVAKSGFAMASIGAVGFAGLRDCGCGVGARAGAWEPWFGHVWDEG